MGVRWQGENKGKYRGLKKCAETKAKVGEKEKKHGERKGKTMYSSEMRYNARVQHGFPQ